MRTHLANTDEALFIPSVNLIGSRDAKLRQLDGVLAQLNAVRRSLANGAATPRNAQSDESRAADRWWLAGVALVALLAMSSLLAWATNRTGNHSAARTIGVVHEAY